MKKIISFLMVTFILAMSIISVSANDFSVSLVASTTNVKAGDTFTIGLTYTGDVEAIPCGDFVIGYDPAKVSIGAFGGAVTGGTVTFNPSFTANSCKLVYGGSVEFPANAMGAVTFTALADGVATFTIETAENICNMDWDDIFPVSLNPVSVTIGDAGSSDPDPVFTVDKAVVDGAVKVTVANAELAEAGKIYVATFNGGVLVDCIEKTIANGTLDFTGLEGDVNTAQMFVWNDQLVPITYATSAQ